MPRYNVVERHHMLVRAAPSTVYAALREADLAGGPVTRLLFALRAVPAVTIAMMRSPRAALAAARHDNSSTPAAGRVWSTEHGHYH